MSPVVLFLSLLVAGALAIALLYLAYFALVNFQPGSTKIRTDLKKMKSEIMPWIDQLVPWSKEEMDLLSTNQVNQKIKKGIITTAKGIFTSVYHEPLIAYSYKKYVSPNVNAVLFVRTSHHEFVYRMKKKGTELFIDNQPVGNITNDGLLYGGKRNRLLARINKKGSELELPIIVGDKERGTLVKADSSGEVNARALQLVTPMGNQEEAVFLSLAILELVNDSIAK